MASRPKNLPPAADLIRFGAFELDLRSRELRKDSRSTGLPEQSIRVLHMLLERPGELVLRDEMRARLWPNDTVVEFDHSINTALRKLRAALGDSADSPRFIETLARRGYRWVGPTVALKAQVSEAGPPSPDREPDESRLLNGQLTGKKVSHYRVLEVLGGGGMGVVYKAEDLKLGRRVALKFLPNELAEDRVALRRLEQEARAASALNHPNVCTIYEIAEHAGHSFIAMEFLEGETLRELISRQSSGSRGMPLDTLIEVGIQISDALSTAHASGIIHRDIKPANVFVTRANVVKILDFGVAKLSQRIITGDDHSDQNVAGDMEAPERVDPVLSPPAGASSLTRTGVTVGTAGYMSPEQVRGEVLDPRTDLFSFGLVLYEMATGKAAFGAATAALMREAILHRDPPPVRELNPGTPEALAQIIRKALEKDRDKRYQSAAEIRADLEPLRRKVVVGSPRVRRITIAAAGLSLLLAASAIIWLSWRTPAGGTSADAKLQQLTHNSWEIPVNGGAISPDGRYLAYADPKGMHIKVVGADDSQSVPQPESLRGEKVVWEINTPGWFPDSRRFIATSHPATEDQFVGRGWGWSSSTSSIWQVAVSGEAPRLLREGARAWSVSPDGSSISFGMNKGRLGERELWLMGSDGGQARKILEVDEARGVCCLVSLKDPTRIAYITSDDSGDALVARDVKGGPTVTLIQPSAMKTIGDVLLLPDGHLIYSDTLHSARFDAPANYWIEPFDTASGELTGRPRRLTQAAGFWLSGATVTADGRSMSFMQTRRESTAYVAEMEPGDTGVRGVRHFTREEAAEDAVTDWTPDSQTAIIVRNRGISSAVYKQFVGADLAEPIVARIDAGLVGNALLSPDADWLILQIWPLPPPADGSPTRPQVWRVPMTGGEMQELFSMPPGSAISCARTPATLCVTGEPTADGRQAVVSAFDPGTGHRGRELLRYDRYLDPDENRSLLAFTLSPDGQWLNTSAAPSGPLQILSLRGDPARVLPVKGLNVTPVARWMPGGTALLVMNGRGDESVVLRVDLQANARVLFKCEFSDECFGVPSPDGRYLGINQTRVTSNIWMIENF
jgi:eukaryotic-like serine/threonine-protein kinase